MSDLPSPQNSHPANPGNYPMPGAGQMVVLQPTMMSNGQMMMMPAQMGQLAPMGLAMPGDMPTHGSGTDDEPPMLDIGGIFKTLLKRWLLISTCFAAMVALGVAYIIKTKPVFSSKASLEVLQEKVQVINGQFGSNDYRSLEILKTFELKLTTQSMLQKIIDLNGLAQDPTFYASSNPNPKPDELIWYLKGKVTVELDRGTRLINIVVKDTDPARAAKLAKSFAEESKNLSRIESIATATQAKNDLDAEVERSQKALAEAEHSAQEFRLAHPGVSLPDKPSELKSTEMEEQQKFITQQIGENRQKLIRLRSICEKIEQVGNKGLEFLVEIPEIAALNEVSQLQSAMNLKEATFAQVEATFLHKHPTHIKAKQELDEFKAQLRIAVDNAATGFQNSYEAAMAEEKRLKEAMSEVKEGALISQEVMTAWEPLRRAKLAKQDYYEQVLRRHQEAEVASNTNGALISIVDYPVEASKPIWPSKKLVLAGAGIAGLALGVGLALLLKLLDSTVRNLAEGEKALRLSALAAIPVEDEKNAALRVVSSPNAVPQTTEAFRALRTSLSLLGKGVHAKTFLFTSPNAGEGKTYCALNHAVTLAQQGYRTLIVDADLRKPSLDELLLGRRNIAGLVSHMHGQSEVDGAKPCNPTRIPNLFLFSAGVTETEHPAELLSGQAFQQLLVEAGKWFHRIVIDTPPVNAVTDALLMAREVDTVALVIKAGCTKRDEAQQALRKLAMAGVKPVGFILNQAPTDALVKGYAGALTPLPTNSPLALTNG